MSIDPLLPRPTSDFLDVKGLKLHRLDWGGNGAAIVIVHATGFLGWVYRPIAQALTMIGHAYGYDQAGHGDSEAPPFDQISWYRTAEELEAFLVRAGLQDVRAWGHSAGGTAIAAVADKRPDLISRAILVEPVIIDFKDPRERPNDLYERTLKRKPSFESVDAMHANFKSKPGYSAWRDDVLRDYCVHGTRPGLDATRILKCTPEIEARLYQTAREFDGLSRILNSKIPMLIVFGGKSDSPGIEFVDRIKQNAPWRSTMIVTNGGHLLPMEQPDALAEIALDFFR
jgi:pimeloyl-ACP methyl ester carboxylesterase